MQRSFQPVKTTIVLTAAMLLACVSASASVRTLDDNNTHDLDDAVTQDDVEVYNSTTVNLLFGGEITGYLEANDNSTVTVSGGTIGGLRVARRHKRGDRLRGLDWELSVARRHQRGDRLRRLDWGATCGSKTTAR